MQRLGGTMVWAIGLLMGCCAAAAAAQIPVNLGQFGDWSATCVWDDSDKKAICIVGAVIKLANRSVTVIYSRDGEQLQLVDKESKTSFIARVDKGAPQNAECSSLACKIAAPELIASLESGSTLTLFMSPPGQASVAVERNLDDMRFALKEVDHWTAQEIERHKFPYLLPSLDSLWAPICEISPQDSARACYLQAQGDWNGKRVVMHYLAGRTPVLEVLAPSGARVYGSIDKNQLWDGACDGKGTCLFRDVGFHAQFAGGRALYVSLAASGQKAVVFSFELEQLRRAVSLANRWMANR